MTTKVGTKGGGSCFADFYPTETQYVGDPSFFVLTKNEAKKQLVCSCIPSWLTLLAAWHKASYALRFLIKDVLFVIWQYALLRLEES